MLTSKWTPYIRNFGIISLTGSREKRALKLIASSHGPGPGRLGGPRAQARTCQRAQGFALVISLAAVLIAIGCQSSPVAPAPRPPPAVHVKKVTLSESTRLLRLSGALEAERTTALSFSVPGTVEQVFVEEGQAVKRGQLIAKVNARSYQDALSIAQSKASQAEDAYKRLKPMADNKTIPEVKMVEVETGLQQAHLSVSMAQKNVTDCVLVAPDSGIVARRAVEPGTSVAPGLPVVTIVQTKTLLAAAPVAEVRVSRTKPGQPARVFVSALDRWFDGSVRDVGVVADPLTRTYQVRVALANPDGIMRVGMLAEVDLLEADQPLWGVVPPESVRVDEKGKPYVFVVLPTNAIEQRAVKVAGYVGEGAAIQEGVSEGESVITSGTAMLASGMTVRVVDGKEGVK